MAKLLSIAFKNIFLYRLWIAATFVSLIMLPPLFTDRHFLYNLEPYPDGLLYSLSARNVVINGELGLRYQDSLLSIWVPPLYPILLIPAYIWNSSPHSFYLANIFLFMFTVYFFDKTLSLFILKRYVHMVGLSILLLHGYVIWVTLVPMSENASLAFFSLLLYLLFKRERRFLFLAGVVSILLIFTRYSMASVTGAVIFILSTLVARSKIHKSRKIIAALTLTSLLLILVVADLLYSSSSIIKYVYNDALSGQVFYGVKYFGINSEVYLHTLSGFAAPFLWMSQPLTTLALFFPAICFISYKCIKQEYSGLVLLSLTLGILLSPLLFYSVDGRYIIQMITVVALGFTLALQDLSTRNTRISYSFAVIGILMLIFSQRHIYKELLAANVLRRSTAWQYEAVKHFDDTLSPSSYLITAIPPHLVDAYQATNYHVLPLSQSQEFLQHKQYVWGNDVNYDDLIATYQSLILQDKAVYITNAYITHQQMVVSDFEKYKALFNLELISEGCYSACNIYKLSANTSKN